MYKKRPKFKPGYSLVMHLSPWELESIEFPATPTKPARTKLCHKVLGWSYKKVRPEIVPEFESVESLINQIKKETKDEKK